jgi:hypothetical protein
MADKEPKLEATVHMEVQFFSEAYRESLVFSMANK